MKHDVVCASGVAVLMDYLEGVLPAGLKADVDEHVASCERCAAYVASYRETPRIVRDATNFELPKELGDSLMAFLRAKRGTPDA
jgi:anti-sigma factor RsiW